MPSTDSGFLSRGSSFSKKSEASTEVSATPDSKEPREDFEENIPPIVIRPMVLLPSEVYTLTDLAIRTEAKKRQVLEEEVLKDGAWQVLAMYLLERVLVSSYNARYLIDMKSSEVLSLRVALPQIEYRRLEQNNSRTVEYSIRLLQRIYRGFLGKRRFRRLRFRQDEINFQTNLHNTRLHVAEEVRLYRFKQISRIQACVKAWSWRRLIRKMRAAATKIQCRFRI